MLGKITRKNNEILSLRLCTLALELDLLSVQSENLL